MAKVLDKARQERARGDLLVPDWEGSEVVSIEEKESNGWVLMSIYIFRF